MWNDDQPYITFFKKSIFLSQEELEKELENHKGRFMTRRNVVVDIIDVKWLFADEKTYADLVPTLAKFCE